MSAPENGNDPVNLSKPGPETPSLDEFLAPIEPRQGRRTLISVVAAVTVLAMVGVAVASIFVWRGDSGGGQATEAPEIAAAAEQYVDSVNRGVAADYLDSVCAQLRAMRGNISDNPPAANPMSVQAVTDVVIEGDVATANVAIAPAGSPDATPRVDQLRFLNEGGWKYCGTIR